MPKINNSIAFFLLIVAFVAGYWLVSFLYSKFKMPTIEEDVPKFKEEAKSSEEQDYNKRQEEPPRRDDTNNHNLAYYSELFNLNGNISADNIKSKYRELLSKYHPDKVSHLGPEFQVIAEQKTRELNKGYDYLKNTYNIN